MEEDGGRRGRRSTTATIPPPGFSNKESTGDLHKSHFWEEAGVKESHTASVDITFKKCGREGEKSCKKATRRQKFEKKAQGCWNFVCRFERLKSL